MPARKRPAGQSQEERDRIALGVIEAYMDGVVSNEILCPSCKNTTRSWKELSPGSVMLLRARYDKLRPTLSTVEQTIHDSRDDLDEGQVLGYLQGLFTAKPDLLDRLIQLRDSARLLQQGEQAIDSARDRVEMPSSSALSDPIAQGK